MATPRSATILNRLHGRFAQVRTNPLELPWVPSRPPPDGKYHPPLSESGRCGLVLAVCLWCGFLHGRALHTDVAISFLIVLACPGLGQVALTLLPLLGAEGVQEKERTTWLRI